MNEQNKPAAESKEARLARSGPPEERQFGRTLTTLTGAVGVCTHDCHDGDNRRFEIKWWNEKGHPFHTWVRAAEIDWNAAPTLIGLQIEPQSYAQLQFDDAEKRVLEAACRLSASRHDVDVGPAVFASMVAALVTAARASASITFEPTLDETTGEPTAYLSGEDK